MEAGKYYCGAAGKLRVLDRRTCLIFIEGGSCDLEFQPSYDDRGAFEEYRYDALGRRILIRTRQEYACTSNCANAVRRTVWDGDQILYEIQTRGGTGTSASVMNQDVGLAPGFGSLHYAYGRVAYTHGMGIDAPLSVIRMEYSDTLSEPTRVIPLANWKGQYDSGLISGPCHYLYYNRQLKPQTYGNEWEDDQYWNGVPLEGYSEHCVEVDWPAQRLWSSYAQRTTWEGHISWMGSLIQHGRDESGQLYRRNRYYDPSSGRFTQEDPIGIAGGLNVYGYAAGDPISYSDPYGLSASCIVFCPARDMTLGHLVGTPEGRALAARAGKELVGLAASAAPRVATAVGATLLLSRDSPYDANDPRASDEILTRFGAEPETAASLQRQAEAAAAQDFPFGVSVTAAPTNRSDVSQARRGAVEQRFPVHDTPTRRNPLHGTVELPNPVTQEAADKFNQVFGRTP